MKKRMRYTALMIIAACTGEVSGPAPHAPPTIAAVAIAPNSWNVLSANIRTHVLSADSVVVQYALADVPGTANSTPPTKTAGDSAMITVLGLLPESRYVFRVIAYNAGGNTVSYDLSLTTGQLPADLPKYFAGGSDPAPGYVVFAAGMYGVVIDNSGRIVWYRRFPNGPGLNFMAEPNGSYVARPTSPDPADSEWQEITPSGEITRKLPCALGLLSRPHDLIIDQDGGYWLMCDEVRTMDLSEVGGVAGARVTGTSVQHVDKNGNLLFSWSPFDHFQITDGEASDRKGSTVNWTHGNAIDFDVDGNLLISFRNLNELTKIDAVSGAVIWRMGGRRNEFTFSGTPFPAFLGQHSVRVVSRDNLVILDNIGTPGESRAELYTLDATARTAILAHHFNSNPGVVTQIGGSVQRLNAGRTLVSFGTAGRVEEYDADGRVMWRIDGNAGYVFRAQRISSLYSPGVGNSR